MNAKKANNTKEKVRELQRKLYLAAKLNSKRRFYAVYDKVYREDILLEAWKRVKANGGAGGIDKISITDVEQYGAEKLIQEIPSQASKKNLHTKRRRQTKTIRNTSYQGQNSIDGSKDSNRTGIRS